MHASDFLGLPLSAKILVVVMLWPAIWGGALLLVALAGDVIGRFKAQTSVARHKAA